MSGGNQGTGVTFHDLEQWLSRPRLVKYTRTAGGDLRLAMELYVWNSRVASAAMSDTCHLEVALRNAYDRELCDHYRDWASDRTNAAFSRTQGLARACAKQDAMNKKSVRALEDARRGLGATPTHGQVVAALSFGFWTKLTERDRAPLFWNPMLHRAFPPDTSRAEVHDLVTRVNKFRNRLAHNEPVFSSRTGLRDRLKDVTRLLEMVLSPSAAELVHRASAVDREIQSCPIPALL